MAETTKHLDLVKVHDCFKRCKREDGSITLDDYIEGYTELSKFFDMFGTVFGFIVSDVNSKLGILREHRTSNCGPNYITIQSMVDFEVDRGITTTKAKLPSGSRTLLRLHRAQEFICLFLQRIPKLSDEDKLCDAASGAYDVSLAKYHPWLVRKGVGLAMYTLPSTGQLMERLAVEDRESTMELLGDIVASIQPVYDTVQKVFSDNNVLSLP